MGAVAGALCCCLLVPLVGGGHPVHPIRGENVQWLGRTKGGRHAPAMGRPDVDGSSQELLAKVFERGEGGHYFTVDHDGRVDHTEQLDMTDYTKKKKHMERPSAVPKGFHVPGEKKADGTYYNEKWIPGMETDLRTRLKNSASVVGDKTQKALREQLGALETLMGSQITRQAGSSEGNARKPLPGEAYLPRPGAGLALEQKLGAGMVRSPERETLAAMVAKAAAPSHDATKADKRSMNKPRLDDLGK